jgi:hypothetical protein
VRVWVNSVTHIRTHTHTHTYIHSTHTHINYVPTITGIRTKGENPCSRYQVDLKAKEFGMCKACGFSQASHRESLKRPGQLKGAALKVKESVTSMNSPSSDMRSKKKRPCKTFKVDLHHPTGFATCLNCGHR